MRLSEEEFDTGVAAAVSASWSHAQIAGLKSVWRVPGDRGIVRYSKTQWSEHIKCLHVEFDLNEEMQVELAGGDEILITFFLDGGIKGSTGDGSRVLDFRAHRAMMRQPNPRSGYLVSIPRGRHNAFVQLRVKQSFFLRWMGESTLQLPAKLLELLREAGGQVLYNAAWSLPTQQCLTQIAQTRLPDRVFLPYLNAKAMELFTLFCHEWALRSLRNPAPGALAADRLAWVEQYIAENLDRQHRIVDLARQVGMSPTTLKQQFSNRYGQPIYAYSLSQRIAHAKELLSNSQLSVFSIARQVGWQCQSRFAQAFSQSVGVSPSAYRSKHRG
jgi:AraC-like DNA-binding protein